MLLVLFFWGGGGVKKEKKKEKIERQERETFIDKFSTRFKTYCDQILIPSTFRVITDALCVLFRKNARESLFCTVSR